MSIARLVDMPQSADAMVKTAMESRK